MAGVAQRSTNERTEGKPREAAGEPGDQEHHRERGGLQNRSDWLPVVVGGQAALSLPAIIDTIDRARASVLSARDIENAVRTEAARLRGAAGADDGAADAAATWIANLPDTLPAGPVAWREWAGVRLRDLGVKGRSAAQSAMQFCLDRGVHLAGFGVGPELRDRRDMPWDVLMARMPPGWPGRHVLLCIDEAQQMSGYVAGSCAPGFYSDLHAFGTPRGFLVAAFGLGDTEAALDKLGVSRSGSAPGTEGHRWRTVGTMPERDVQMAARRCFRACGVRRDTEAQVWEDAIVKASNGWAQHLRHYLAFAVRAALAVDGACRRDDLAGMLEAGDAERLAYYKKRIGALGAHEGCAWEMAAHLKSCGGVSRRTALAAIVSADLRAQGVSEITKEAVDQCLTTRSHHCRLHQIASPSPRPRNVCARADNVPDNDHTSSTTPLLPQQRRSAGYFAYPFTSRFYRH